MFVNGIYRSIEPPSRIVFSWNIEPPDEHAGLQSEVTVRIVPERDGCELQVRHERLTKAGAVERHSAGWRGALDQLATLLDAAELRDGQGLAADVRAHLAGMIITEIGMFGGIGFMLDGNLVVAVSKRGLLLRVGKERHKAALARTGARPMEMRGRIIEGYIHVEPAMLTSRALQDWLDEAVTFVKTLPPKTAAAKSVRKGRRQ
jgi:TfoX/Sxy family transcriptional regulator of competence genes